MMINTSFEQRTKRRNRLIGLLRSEEYWKTSDLREQLGGSQQTLMRELAELILSLAIMESLKSQLLTSNLKTIKQKLFQAYPQEQHSAVSNISAL
ncbi:hypothetical protein [Marinomonas mediterranea]|uniref:hypothetical protein n=1 Tax=Marinomonas mediterranea TaxID=119864 RepID=UPI00234A076D|nr:hypothetical protein [Marinomonas mediterranea]